MAGQETIRRRKPKDVGQKPIKNKKEKETPMSINKYAAMVSAGLLGIALFAVLYQTSGNKLTSQPYLPLVYPECCTGSEDQLHRLWGSYRPQVYFGMRPRIPHSAIFGLMWLPVKHLDRLDLQADFRHTSEQNQLKSFTWTRHDGNKFGIQTLKDDGFNIETSFVKSNIALQDWSAKIEVQGTAVTNTPTAVNLFWYIGIEHSNSKVMMSRMKNGASIYGETAELGKFSMAFKTRSEKQRLFYTAVQCAENVPLHQLSELVKERLRPVHLQDGVIIAGLQDTPDCSVHSNMIIVQLTIPMGSTVEVVYENLNIERSITLEGQHYDALLTKYVQEFDDKFEEKFRLKNKGYNKDYISFAKSAFSNLIGGIGYFHGKSIVISSQVGQPTYYWPASLYTAVPSRSFFPRGFLWDEGFHQLLVGKWDKSITLEVIGHWLNLMNADGWIPREQILGNEALMKVPPEFVVQNADYANPPTLFLALDSLLNNMEPAEILDHHSTLRKMYHRLTLWYNWYNSTQTGPLPTTYRWRGRNGTTDMELNPKTLTSGLDDYPRASHPSEDEYHLDLRCWVAFASRSIATLGELIGLDVTKYKETADLLSDNELLKKLHWTGAYFTDYGLHSDNVGLRSGYRRVVKKVPAPKLVPVQGYINLFPLILNILNADSPELGVLLNNLRDPSNIWSPHGLCSVGKSDKYYLKYNTEHDQPYWRGPIWININYLTIRALHNYSKLPGPYQTLCSEIYAELRSNLISTVFREYQRTGYIWEQYNCATGRGQSVHPFTGWSSLIVLIMGEHY